MSRRPRKTRADPQQLRLFEDAPPPAGAAPVTAAPRRLYYATNAGNLRGILAAGLIRPKEGWPKYAPDFQELTPGCIPFFVGGVPHGEIGECVTRHDRNDLPVVVEFDAETWSASGVLCVRADGRATRADLADLPGNVRMLLFRGVIPLWDARGLHFPVDAAARRFVSDCRIFSNTRADLLPIHADLSGVPDRPLPPIESTEPRRSQSSEGDLARQMRRLDSIGGILAAVARMSPEGDGPRHGRRGAGSVPSPRGAVRKDAIEAVLDAWIDGRDCRTDDSMSAVLKAALDFLSAPAAARGLVAERLLDAVDRPLLAAGPSRPGGLPDLLRSLRGVVLGDDSASGFFRRAEAPLPRGLLLFLLDPDYAGSHTPPSGCTPLHRDLFVAEVFRGALHGWSRVPVSLRGDPASELAAGYAMARCHNRMEGALRLDAVRGPVPARLEDSACG